MSDQPSPTNKAKVHLEAVYGDTYWQVNQLVDQVSIKTAQQVQLWSWQDGHQRGFRMAIAESMSITDQYRLQEIIYRACRGTAQSLLARMNIVSITIIERLTCEISANERRLHAMQLTYTIADHGSLQMMPGAEASIDAKS